MQLRDILAAFYDTYKNGKEINYKNLIFMFLQFSYSQRTKMSVKYIIFKPPKSVT